MTTTKNIWFKCIFALTIIAIISGGLLAILNTVLAVSPTERTERAITKIYGELKEYESILDVDNEQSPYKTEDGEISKIYRVNNEKGYDLLFKATGYNGFKNGTITLWVKVTYENSTPTITKIILDGYTKQTLMGMIGDSFYGGFYVDLTESYRNGKFTATNKEHANYNPVSGATYSATAGCNAINVVVDYVNNKGV